MLEKPNLSDATLIGRLRDEYALGVSAVAFLPLGADANTAVYRIETTELATYFLKLRRGPFDDIAVLVPGFLRDAGIEAAVAPLPTRSGALWTRIESYSAILYPFVDGENGFDTDLSSRQWTVLGESLRAVHSISLPETLKNRLRREDFSPRWRDLARSLISQATGITAADPVTNQLATVLKAKRDVIFDLLDRSERLSATLQRRALDMVLCHTDIHGGNVLAGSHDTLHMVDWDSPMLAPRERDLMFVVGDVAGVWFRNHDAAAFWLGYGEATIDPIGLAFYRYERIVEDIAVNCQTILHTDAGENRAQELRYLVANFEPNGVIERAYRSDHEAPRR